MPGSEYTKEHTEQSASRQPAGEGEPQRPCRPRPCGPLSGLAPHRGTPGGSCRPCRSLARPAWLSDMWRCSASRRAAPRLLSKSATHVRHAPSPRGSPQVALRARPSHFGSSIARHAVGLGIEGPPDTLRTCRQSGSQDRRKAGPAVSRGPRTGGRRDLPSAGVPGQEEGGTCRQPGSQDGGKAGPAVSRGPRTGGRRDLPSAGVPGQEEGGTCRQPGSQDGGKAGPAVSRGPRTGGRRDLPSAGVPGQEEGGTCRQPGSQDRGKAGPAVSRGPRTGGRRDLPSAGVPGQEEGGTCRQPGSQDREGRYTAGGIREGRVVAGGLRGCIAVKIAAGCSRRVRG